MMTLVARCITQKSIPLPLKTPRLQSHIISQFRTAALGSQPIPVSELTSLTSPFRFSHKCHWLGCFSSPNIKLLHALSFRCILLAPSPGIVTSEPELNGHPPSPITYSLIHGTTHRQIISQLCHELSPPLDGVPLKELSVGCTNLLTPNLTHSRSPSRAFSCLYGEPSEAAREEIEDLVPTSTMGCWM